jgi:hypothetical protein
VLRDIDVICIAAVIAWQVEIDIDIRDISDGCTADHIDVVRSDLID